MKRCLAIVVVMTMAVFPLYLETPVASAQGKGKFPGKGSYEAWQKAHEIFLRGLELAKAGKAKEAIPLLEKAVQIYNQDANFPYILALAYRDEVQYKKAEKYYKMAIALDYTFPEAWCGLGKIYLITNRFSESKYAYEKAVEQAPNDSDRAKYRKGVQIVEQKMSEEAHKKNSTSKEASSEGMTSPPPKAAEATGRSDPKTSTAK